MSDGLLPQRVNIRKAVARAARYTGGIGVEQLRQFGAVFEADKPNITVVVEFGEDEAQRQYAQVTLTADVVLECQRCLKPIQRRLQGDSRLAIVRDDEEACQLPEGYEPCVAVDEVDLWEVAAEELALVLPVVAYHPQGECSPPAGYKEKEIEDPVAASGAGPFSILSALLKDDTGK
ncbi:MAG: hypothetical protein ACI87W_002322 [Halieaceae bacterium]|jgi:uncharacterized protein